MRALQAHSGLAVRSGAPLFGCALRCTGTLLLSCLVLSYLVCLDYVLRSLLPAGRGGEIATGLCFTVLSHLC